MFKLKRPVLLAALVVGLGVLWAPAACTGDNTLAAKSYDYYLATEEDVITPPSGTAGAWVTIRGADAGGNGGGKTYYVSSTGNDNNPGTKAKPWATPAYGAAQLKPGDTLVILAREAGARPVLGAKNNLGRGLDLSGARYVRVENLELTSADGAPFRDGVLAVGAPTAHVVLNDLYVHHLDEFGMDFGDVDDVKIINCDVAYCGYGALGGPAGEAGGWTNVVIKGCRFLYSGHYYRGGPGPGPYDRPDGFGIEASGGPVEIVDTVAAHNRGDGLDSKAENTYIHECVVANNSCDGVKLWGGGSRVVNCLIYGRGDGDAETTPWSALVIGTEDAGADFEYVNVTVDDYVGNNYVMYAQYDNPNVPINLTMKNVIFGSRGPNAPIYLGDAVNFTFSYNLFYMPQSDDVLIHGNVRNYNKSELGQLGPGNKYGEPRFIKPAFGTEGDYHLRDGSPAIDAGTGDGAPDEDLDGEARPRGGGYDIGAYER